MKPDMRKLATIRKIDAVDPIPNADAIEVATVGGWKGVVKKCDFSVGDTVIYCEIDSWIPTAIAPFLSNGKESRVYNGVLGERLRTIKLRKQVSQGLLLPISVIGAMGQLEIGADVTELLGIQKWEAPIPAQLAGEARGLFPSSVPKTNQERVQNLTNEWGELSSHTYEVTEKLDGSSCTFFLDSEGEFHVCSRNIDLKPSETNSFWKAAVANNVEQKMRENGLIDFAIQGELIGEGIQGNPYKLGGQEFYVFDMYYASSQIYVAPTPRWATAAKLGLNHVPMLSLMALNKDVSIEYLLTLAEGKSVLHSQTEREGLVFKQLSDPSISFKAISNKFLLKENEK